MPTLTQNECAKRSQKRIRKEARAFRIMRDEALGTGDQEMMRAIMAALVRAELPSGA